MGYSRPQPVPASRTVGYHLLEAASAAARATAGSSSSVAVAEEAELATEAAIAAVDELAWASRSQMAGATAAVEVHVDASDS